MTVWNEKFFVRSLQIFARGLEILARSLQIFVRSLEILTVHQTSVKWHVQFFVQKRLCFNYFSYFCNKYCWKHRRRCQSRPRDKESLSAGWRYHFCGTNNSISYLFRVSWNVGNFIDWNALSKSADARAIARAWLISSISGNPTTSRYERRAMTRASFVSWGLLVLPVSKPEDIACMHLKLSYYGQDLRQHWD